MVQSPLARRWANMPSGRMLPWLVLIFCITMVAAYWHHEVGINNAFGRLRFIQKSEKLQAVAEKRMASYEGILRAGRGLLGATRIISQERWRIFVDALALGDNFPGIDWIAFISPVQSQEREWFEENVLMPVDSSHRIITDQKSSDYFVITYIAPDDLQTFVPGYDIGTEQNRRIAAERARDTGRPALSRLYFQKESQGRVSGLLHLLPIFAEGMPVEDENDRRDALLGWVAAGYQVKNLFFDIFEEAGSEVRVEVFDGLMYRPDAKVYDSNPQLPASLDPDDPWVRTAWLIVGGGKWTVRFSATPYFLETYMPGSLLFILAAGLILSATVAFAVWALLSSREKALALAAKMTRASQESEIRFQRAVEWAPIPVMIHDSHGQVIVVNHRWCELSRVPKNAISTLESWISQCCPSESQEHALATLGSPFTSESQVKEGMFLIHTGTDLQRVWLMRSRPLGLLPDGREIIISMAMDITELKATEQALRHAKIGAETANLAKSDFLATMSHEIRTPMNAIIGLAEVLSESSLTLEQSEYLTIIRRSGDHLLELINDILDLSKVESGRLELDSEVFHLKELLDKLMGILVVRARAKGLYLRLETDPQLPVWVRGDDKRLRQVLINLVGNALKFTHQGGVTLTVGLTGEKANIAFEVADTGIGIPESAMNSIFEAFTQVDHSTTRKYGGSGLGLTISRRLIELMGGSIQVFSQEGTGSLFRFVVVLPEEEGLTKCAANAEQGLEGLRVLVVDDNPDSRLLLASMVGGLGGRAEMVASDREGSLSLHRGAAAGEPFHLLVLADHLGQDNALATVQGLRHRANQPTLPAVVVSNFQREGELAQARSLGIGMVLKPLKRKEFRLAICQSMACLPKPALLEHSHALDILLVDDSEDNVLLMQAYLAKSSHRLAVAVNGAEGVAQVKNKRYDLVLMDVQMPIMDGYAATRAIRTWEKEGAREPVMIVALTANAFPEDLQRSLEAGCDAHLSKPIGKAKLLAEIGRFQQQLNP